MARIIVAIVVVLLGAGVGVWLLSMPIEGAPPGAGGDAEDEGPRVEEAPGDAWDTTEVESACAGFYERLEARTTPARMETLGRVVRGLEYTEVQVPPAALITMCKAADDLDDAAFDAFVSRMIKGDVSMP